MNMQLLDAINWGLILWPVAYFVLVGGVLDGFFVYRFLRLKKFHIAFLEALFANIFSLFVGFLAWPYIFPNGFDFADLSIGSYFALWLVTVFAEAFILRVLNRSHPFKPILAASACMNLVSFVVMYLFFLWKN